MGAVVVRDGEKVVGVTFRVWAPHATAVYVDGGWNGWQHGAALARENDAGYWSGHVAEARPGDEYKFALDTPSGMLHRNDPYARAVTSSVGNAIVVDDAAFDWGDDRPVLHADGGRPWSELVIYEMHVGTFFDADGNHLGTFDEAAARLTALREQLGVTAVELMPVAEFAGDRSWGYNPAHPFAVEGAYGGPDGLKRFVKAAHAAGLAVIVDVLYNHFGPSDLDLWQFDGWSENGKGGIYFYNDHRSATPWGDTRPDYGRPEVRQYILDNARMWLDAYRVDGLRLDMVLYMRNCTAMPCEGDALPDGWSLMQEINDLVARDYPGRITIAEDLQTEAAVTALPAAGGAGFGAQWDAQFVHPVRAVLQAPTDADRSMDALVGALRHRYDDDVFHRVVYTESHDEVSNGRQRIVSEVAQQTVPARGDDDGQRIARHLAALGAVLVATAPGIPMIFQGQDLLQDGWFDDTRVLVVTDDDGTLSMPHKADAEAMAGDKGDDTLVRLMGDLFRLRTDDPATVGLRRQGLTVLAADDAAKVLAFARHDESGGPETVVVLNLAEQAHDAYPVPMPVAGPWTLRFNASIPDYHPAFEMAEAGDATAADGDDGPVAHVPLAPYGALIYTRA